MTNDVWAIRSDHAEVAAAIMAGEYETIADGGMGVANDAGAVSVIPIRGIITQDGGFGTSTKQLGEWLDAAAADKETKAIVLDVHSPGGSVFGVEEVTAKVRAAAEKKPVVAVANGMMASAAYWIASGARKIVASPSADVGSIGVIMVHADYSKLLDGAGVKVSFITSAKHKAEGNMETPLGDEARAHMQSRVDAYHQSFVSDISKGRNITVAAVGAHYGEGRSFGASAAKTRGMVDQIATLEQVIGRLLPRGSGPRMRMRTRSQRQKAEFSSCQR